MHSFCLFRSFTTDELVSLAVSIVEALFESSTDEERDDDDETPLCTSACLPTAVRKRVRIVEYAESVVPRYSDSEYKRHFRLRVETVGW